jgi:hypothetical protein
VKEFGGNVFKSNPWLYSYPDKAAIVNHFLLKYYGDESTYQIPADVKSIASYAFDETQFTDIVILPEGMTSIGVLAFGNSKIKGVKFSSTIKSIEDRAFSRCSLESIHVPSTVASIGANAFENNYNLKTANIPASIKEMGLYVFLFCKSLKTVTLEKGLTFIPPRTFWGCESLSNVIVPNTVKRLGFQTFEQCTSLKTITLPKSIIEINSSAFEGAGLQVIICSKGSIAYEFAKKKGYKTKSLS